VRLGIDIDGVVLDFVTAFCEVCRERYGYHIGYSDIFCHDLGEVLGIGSSELKPIVTDTLDSHLIQPYPGAVEGLTRLRNDGHVINLITSRPESLREKTISILKENRIEYDDLSFAPFLEKTSNAEGIDLFVEDSLSEALELIRNGTGVLVFKHPWNEKSLNVSRKLRYVQDWPELVAVIRDIAKRPV
jgi:uncharacterized HAD superfamily protein